MEILAKPTISSSTSLLQISSYDAEIPLIRYWCNLSWKKLAVSDEKSGNEAEDV